jgi:auxin influx carrier (AUX1 LAX family)
MGACEDELGENGYTHNEAEAIEKGTINGEANNNYSKQQQQQEKKTIASTGSLHSLWKKTIWHGGSVYDAWLNAVAAQVGQVILSMPTSYSQMGYKWGVFFQIFYFSIGMYTCYLLARLYVEYRVRKERDGVDFNRHVIQYHEVLGSLVGLWAQRVALFFNIVTVGAVAVVQIIACASNAYYLNPHHNKRTWTIVFGAISLVVILLPTIHNFRIWSFLGVLTTTYTAWYMFSTSIAHGQVPNVKHSAPIDLQSFFTGTTNILFASGGHAITIEIMHAMWKPAKYKYVYIACCFYVFSITIPHSLAVYWAFGDELLHKNNAFAVLPSSNARSTAIIFMIMHQAVAFGLYIMPLNFMWEKLWGVHQSPYLVRVLVRLPVVLLLWFLALAFPFFGPLNSLIGSLFMSFSTFIIPSIAYIITFWTPKARENEAEKPNKPRRIVGWRGMVVLNLMVVLLIFTLGTGFGSWASVEDVIDQIKTFGVFQKCYQC